MSGKPIGELTVGISVEVLRTYDEWDIFIFVVVTGDLNPAHTDEAFAEGTPFRGRVAHGKWLTFFEKVENEEFVKLFLAMESWTNDNIAFPGEACGDGKIELIHIVRTEGENMTTLAWEHPDTLERLQAVVREHRVCWEVWPEQLAGVGHRPVQVGFDLVLNGAHAHDTDRPSPGCERCEVIFEHLREIAEWIVPKVERPSRYDIQIFDHAVHYAPERGNRPDVALTIKILHRSEIDRPVDECEVLCLNEMKARLSRIGAQHRQWADLRTS